MFRSVAQSLGLQNQWENVCPVADGGDPGRDRTSDSTSIHKAIQKDYWVQQTCDLLLY